MRPFNIRVHKIAQRVCRESHGFKDIEDRGKLTRCFVYVYALREIVEKKSRKICYWLE